jgi:hypothetical protein
VVLPDSVVEHHASTSTGHRTIACFVKARPVRGDGPSGPQSQEALQVLSASRLVCAVHRPSVLREERLMLAIRQDAKNPLRIERILRLGVGG